MTRPAKFDLTSAAPCQSRAQSRSGAEGQSAQLLEGKFRVPRPELAGVKSQDGAAVGPGQSAGDLERLVAQALGPERLSRIQRLPAVSATNCRAVAPISRSPLDNGAAAHLSAPMIEGCVATLMRLTPVCDDADPAVMTSSGSEEPGGPRAQPGAPEIA